MALMVDPIMGARRSRAAGAGTINYTPWQVNGVQPIAPVQQASPAPVTAPAPLAPTGRTMTNYAPAPVAPTAAPKGTITDMIPAPPVVPAWRTSGDFLQDNSWLYSLLGITPESIGGQIWSGLPTGPGMPTMLPGAVIGNPELMKFGMGGAGQAPMYDPLAVFGQFGAPRSTAAVGGQQIIAALQALAALAGMGRGAAVPAGQPANANGIQRPTDALPRGQGGYYAYDPLRPF